MRYLALFALITTLAVIHLTRPKYLEYNGGYDSGYNVGFDSGEFDDPNPKKAVPTD
jgi:hypothetical protein